MDLRREGRTVIFSTHLMENAERMCDSVCIIARGEKVLDGAITDVKSQHGGRFVALALGNGVAADLAPIWRDASLIERCDDSNRTFEIELAPGADPQELLHRVLKTGARVERFELVQPSLHRIFLDKVGITGVEEGMTGHG